MRIPDQKTKPILMLIAEGQNLNPMDLGDFYRWAHDSYETLGFDRFQQQRFDEYCRSSRDSISMRVYCGVWILKLALGGFVRQERLPEPQKGAGFHPAIDE